MSDKNVVKTSGLRFDPPNSAGALYQFLSRYPIEASVKLEGAYTAPVIKVRDSEPKKLDTQSRDAWSFYLLNMQQAVAGTGRANGQGRDHVAHGYRKVEAVRGQAARAGAAFDGSRAGAIEKRQQLCEALDRQ